MSDELVFSKYQATGNDFVMILDLDDQGSLEAGGDLEVERLEDGEVELTGDAVRVFDGSMSLARPSDVGDLRR